MSGPTFDLISTSSEIQSLAKKLSQYDHLAFDTEFIRESTFYPRLEILQIATRDEAWLIDVQAFQLKSGRARQEQIDREAFQPLLDVFTNPKILKIVHAAHGDQECLLSAFGTLATPIFDTSVGASLCGLGDNIGLGNLMKEILNVEHPKGYARTNWSKRPLPKPVLEYALLDVRHLIEIGDLLFERLEKVKRKEWALELSAKFSERALFEMPVELVAKRLAQSGKFNVRDYGVLLELVRWREARVRELNVPKRWLADDGVLIDLAKIKPTTIDQLNGFRGLSKGEVRSPYAERILSAVERGKSGAIEVPEDLKKRSILQPTGEESRVIDLLRVCLALLADEYQLASKHIVQPQALLPLVRLRAKTVEDLIRSELVSPQLGVEGTQQLFDFLTGNSGLTLVGGKVTLSGTTLN